MKISAIISSLHVFRLITTTLLFFFDQKFNNNNANNYNSVLC